MLKTRWLVGGAAVSLLMAALFLLAPWWSLSGLAKAAYEADKQRLSMYVDFPRLRESLRAQMNAQFAESMAEELKDNPFAALGTFVGSAMVDKAIDAFVTPEGAARLLKGAMEQRVAKEDREGVSRLDAALKLYDMVGLEWLSSRDIRMTVYDDVTDEVDARIMLERDWLTWRVVDFEIPDLD